ncbi:MAG: tRNA-dihydrouridine synthase [Clostridiaceae bacterium]|nr:tRNA-dihydrouridine synthase [Clostridiaceae bacterium]
MDLSVNFIGLSLKNPILISAGPLTGSGEMMRKAVEAGAGAVVTKTIANEIRSNVRPRLVKGEGGLHNIELYSDFTLEEWEGEIAYAKKHGAIVIANILGHTPSEIAYIAQKVERYGADAIELGVSCPHGEGLEGVASEPSALYEFTKAVVKRVKIPVMVKLSSNVANVVKLAKAAEKAGAAAISGIDTVRSIAGVDIETGQALLPTFGGYSGDAIRPIGLAAIASISEATSIPACGIGGITKHEHILEYMMLGASTVQVCTSIILNGHEHIGLLLDGLRGWMTQNGYESFDEIKGKALTSLKSFEEIKEEPYVSQVNEGCSISLCEKCKKACIYEAIEWTDGQVTVNPQRCTGCGLCVSICPQGIFELNWKD